MSLREFIQQLDKRPDELYAVVPLERTGLAQDLQLPSFLSCREFVPLALRMWFSAGGTTSVMHQESFPPPFMRRCRVWSASLDFVDSVAVLVVKLSSVEYLNAGPLYIS